MTKEEINKASYVAPNNASVLEVFYLFLKLGLSAFGGPVAHVAYFRKEFVERRAWLADAQFSQLFALCQVLPGPASSQLGFLIGLNRSGLMGAIAAFTAFTLPSALLLFFFALAVPMLDGPLAEALIHGLKLSAVAIVSDALLSMSRGLCPDKRRKLLALMAAALLLTFNWPFMQLIVLGLGAAYGFAFCKPLTFLSQSYSMAISRSTALLALSVFVFLFILLPVAVMFSGINLLQVAAVFYQSGSLVFGGGHVVLPLLQQATVDSAYIDSSVFMAGYGATQAMPGPMFSFASFLGAYMQPNLPWLGALTALIFVFLPGFLLVVAVFPFWQQLIEHQVATKCLAGLNATVVGILLAALLGPIASSTLFSFYDLGLAATALIFIRGLKLSPLLSVAFCVLASVILTFL